MGTNSKIGSNYNSEQLRRVPDATILIEAAMRRGQSLSNLITPNSPNQQRIDLQQWKNALTFARSVVYPNRNPLYDVLDNIRIDLHLSSGIDTRILKVQQTKFVVKDKSDKINDELTLLFKKMWFHDFLAIVMESRFEGFRLVELTDVDLKGLLNSVKEVNKYHVKPDKGIVTKNSFDESGTSYLDGPISDWYLPIGKKDDLGILFKVAPSVLAKKYAIGAWSEYNEKIGIPFRTVTSPALDDGRRKQLAVIMEKMGSAGWAVLNENEKVELLLNSGSDPTKCFDGLIKLLDSQVSKYLLGQDQTSNSADNKGTYGSMEILQGITQDRHEADLTYCNYVINDLLIPKLIKLGYPSNIGRIEWDRSVDLGVSDYVDSVQKLSSFYDIDPEQITEKTGIKILGKKENPTLPQPSGTPPATPPKGAKKK